MVDNRTLHRWVSIPLALFFLVIAVTGVALQLDMWIEGKSPPGSEPPPPPVRGYSAAEAQLSIARALGIVSTAHPDAKITGISIDRAGKIVTVGIKGPKPASMRVDLTSGALLPPAPPMERGWHYVLQDIHAGYFAGPIGRVISVICGLGMLFLSMTGFVVYWNLFRRRWKMGRKSVFWR